MIVRRDISEEVLSCAREYPVVTILGPRQAGKTTLVKALFPKKPYFNLEEPDIRMAAEADPRGFLSQAPEGAILDEVQRCPFLLSHIQGEVDRKQKPGEYILTGSHQPRLQEAISQSLAGRTAVLTLWPLSFNELRNFGATMESLELIVKGTFPGLHKKKTHPRRFYGNYVQTHVERDVRALANLRDLSLFQRFLQLLAGRIGQMLNISSLATDTGVSATTIRHWLDILKASFLIFETRPFHANIRRRLVKSPKIYFTDTGLASFLLGIHDTRQAFRDPLRGNLYENMVVSEIARCAFNRGIRPELFFLRDSHGNEVDLLIKEGGHLAAVEIKSAKTFSPSFCQGILRFKKAGMDISRGFVLYDGEAEFLTHGIRTLNPLQAENLWELITAPEG